MLQQINDNNIKISNNNLPIDNYSYTKNRNSFFRFEDNMPLIIGHRGMFHHNQNSLSSFKKAIKNSIPIIELDIWLTKDNKIVVIHCFFESDCISETTNGIGKVEDFTYEEIINFKFLNSKEGNENNEGIPSLNKVFEECKNQVKFIIEIKEKNKKKEIIDQLLNEIRTYNLEKDVIISSFYHEYYDILRECNSDIEFKFNIDLIEEVKPLLDRDLNKCIRSSVCCNSNIITKEDVDIFHSKQQAVSVYLYPDNKHDENLFAELIKKNIDHYIVDEPDLAVIQLIKALNQAEDKNSYFN